MKWMQIRACFHAPHGPEAEELICACFYEAGVTGVVLEDADPAKTPSPDPGGTLSAGAVIGYLPCTSTGERGEAALEEALGALSRQRPEIEIRFSRSLVDEEDWAESWKRFFWPERVGESIVIKPTWREYAAAGGEVVIEIDPGMAFGTGTHPTSVLCLKMLERHLRRGQSLLDVGTGSGVLLVAGALLGAGRGLGIDNDPVAVTVAAQNLAQNRINQTRFGVAAGHLSQPVKGSFDVVVANILADVIVALSADLTRVVRPGGLFIGSGIVASAELAVCAGLEAVGLRIVERHADQEWVCLVAQVPLAVSTRRQGDFR